MMRHILTRAQSDRNMRTAAWGMLIAIYLILAGIVLLAVWMIVAVIKDSLACT